MSDIVRRLLSGAAWPDGESQMRMETAAEIERLRAALATARREGAVAMREAAALEVEEQTMEGHTRRACVASWQEACAHAAAAIRDLPGDDA